MRPSLVGFGFSLLATAVGLSGCVHDGVRGSQEEWDLYGAYYEALDLALPIPLSAYSRISFRRYDSYARSSNLAEFSGSIDWKYDLADLIGEATYRQMEGENLYGQLLNEKESSLRRNPDTRLLLPGLHWKDVKIDSKECPAVNAAILSLNTVDVSTKMSLPESVKLAPNPVLEEITVRIHPTVYELAYRALDSNFVLTVEDAEHSIAQWIDGTILALRSCAMQSSNNPVQQDGQSGRR